ncbi:MAG: TlpA family protein disulfide reductase [Polyangiaceae bacterium]
MAACSVLLIAACKKPPAEADRGTGQVSGSSAGAGPRFVPAPPGGDLAAAVARAVSDASAGHRMLVVYVGATWCEPCQRFHHAIEQGELASVDALARVTFLELDLDRDRERLEAAGYRSKYIPLFALPGPDGRSSGKQVEGGIKGDGAVAYMVPRLTSLLSM